MWSQACSAPVILVSDCTDMEVWIALIPMMRVVAHPFAVDSEDSDSLKSSLEVQLRFG